MFNRVIATAIFVQDLTKCTEFYRDMLTLKYLGSDAESSTFMIKDQYLTLLNSAGAADLLNMQPDEIKFQAPHVVVAASVEDVDATYEELKAKGVTFVRPPTDQPWGLRTAHFADPEGNLWEINHSLESKTEE